MGVITRYAPGEKDHDRPEWGDVAAWANQKAARELAASRRPTDLSQRHATGNAPLDIHDMKAVLDFEVENHSGGAKEELILDRFWVLPARYYQRLNTIIVTREALEYNPILVNRLLERLEARVAARAGRHLIPGRES